MKFNKTYSYWIFTACAIVAFASLKSPRINIHTFDDTPSIRGLTVATPLQQPFNTPSESENDSEYCCVLHKYYLPHLPLLRTIDISFWDMTNTGIQIIFVLEHPPKSTLA